MPDDRARDRRPDRGALSDGPQQHGDDEGACRQVRNTLARQKGLVSEMRGDATAWRIEN